MKKFLFSIMLMVVFSIPFTTQAETMITPIYKVDVTRSAVGIGLNESIAVSAIESTQTLRSFSEFKSIDTIIKMATRKQKTILIGQCGSCHADKLNGVSGGDSIGGRRFG